MSEQEEFEFRRRLEEEEAAASQAAPSASEGPAELINPLYTTLGGAIGAEIVAPAINKGAEAFQDARAARATGTNAPSAAPNVKVTPQTTFNPKGVSVEQSLDNWRTYNEAQNEAAKTIRRDAALAKKYPNLTRAPSPAAQNLAAQKAQLAAKAPTLGSKIAAKTPGVVKDLGAAGNAMMKSGVTPWLGRGIAGAALGFEGADAYNRYQTGDTTGSIISGLGALGSAASLIPHPVTRIVGTGLGLGAGALNAYRDRQREKEMQNVVGKAGGGAIHGYNAGSAVKGIKGVAKVSSKKPVNPEAKGYLHHTTINPNPLVGTRYETRDLGGLLPVKQMRVEDLKGAMVNTNPWDLTSRNVAISSVSGRPLTKEYVTHGGHGYARDIEHQKNKIAGASSKEIAKRVQNRADEAYKEAEKLGGSGKVYTAPGSMGTFSENFALPTTEIYYDLFQQANLPKSVIKQQSDYIRNIPGKNNNYPYSKMPDLDDPDIMNLFEQNPDFRKEFLKLQQFKNNQKLLGVNAEDISNAMTDKDLMGLPRGYAGHTMIEMIPGAEILPTKSTKTYPFDTQGIYGGSIGHTPIPVLLNRPYEKAFQVNRAKYPNKPEAAIRSMAIGALERRKNGISEFMDEEAINRIGQYHEGVKQGKVDPLSIESGLKYIKQPGIYAEGGGVQGYNAGKKVVDAGLGFVKPATKSHSQNPKVARALEEYLKGNISQAERIAIMNKQLPLRPWTEMPPAYTDEQIKMALMENKRPKALADVPVGARVGNRLDIPAYTQHGVYVDTTHDLAKGNSPISYNRTGHLKDVEFSSKPNQAVRVGLGTKEQALTPMGAEMGSAKSPFALIKGTNQGTSDEEVRRMMAELMKDPSYAQIGMDPRRHSQFYDKSTGMPVWAAEEKLQSGPLILVPKRGLETTSWDDPRLNLSDFPGKQYAEGGKTAAWQRKEGKNPEGGLNAAGRASYNRETGGNLKAPQPEGGPRKKSFCARMEGMKRKNTSSATANDPDSRINKSLRKWKC
jgi:hypothetical protein